MSVVPSDAILFNRLNGDEAAFSFDGSITAYVLEHRPEVLSGEEHEALRAQRSEYIRIESLKAFNRYVGYGDEPDRGRVVFVERLNSEPPVLRLVGTAATTTATMAQVAEWRRAKPKLMEASNRVPQRPTVPTPAGPRPRAWDRILPALMAAAAPVDVGAETTDSGLGRQYVEDYVAAYRPGSDPLEVTSHEQGLVLVPMIVCALGVDHYFAVPYRLGSHIHIQTTPFRQWLNLRDERLSRQRLASILRSAGGRTSRVGHPPRAIWTFPYASQ